MSSLAAPRPASLHAAVAGDADALDALLRAHRDAIVAVCRRRLRSRVDADDAVQETMVRAMQSLSAVRDENRLQAYLCRIAERVCLDMMRAGARPMPVLADPTAPDEPESIAIRREEAELVRRTLRALSARQAEALWMRDALGDAIPDVAEHLGVTEGSARVLLTRARHRMRDGWSKAAALLPGLGLKLPAPLAKLVGAVGVVPAIAAPAVLVAAVWLLPGLVGSAVAPGQAPPVGLSGPSALPGAAAAAASAPDLAVPGGPVQQLPVPTRVGGSADAAGVADGRSATDGTRVSTPAVDIGIDRDDRDDDDVTAGDPDLLGVGASVGELLGEEGLGGLGAHDRSLDLSTDVVELEQ